jgi:DNA-directed RNA polymerase subunit RPC12/RpoP
MMTIVRQMPKIYVRGSIANITMKNLSPTDKANIDALVARLFKHEKLQSSKSSFVRALRNTIGADYKDDIEAALAEFQIPIWNAVVQLLCHKQYSYHCSHCKSSEYTNKEGISKLFDRTTYVPCPNCKHTKILIEDDSKIIHIDDLPDYIVAGEPTPQCYPIIEHLAEGPKHAQAEAILNDEQQLIKFVSSYIQNYEKQILRENKPAKTIKQVFTNVDAFDHFQPKFLGLFAKHSAKISIFYNESKDLIVVVDGLLSPVELTEDLLSLQKEASAYGIVMKLTNDKVYFNGSYSVGFSIKERKTTFVSVNDDSTSSARQDGKSSLDNIPGGHGMRYDDHTEELAIKEGCLKVRLALNDQDRDVFDILACTGPVYDAYAETFGEGRPCNGHIARFLNRNRKSIKDSINTIRVVSMANDLVPSAY